MRKDSPRRTIGSLLIHIFSKLEISIRCLNLLQAMSWETQLCRRSYNSSRIPYRVSKKKETIGITSQQAMLPSKDSFRRVDKYTLSLPMSPVVQLAFPRYQPLKTVNQKASTRIAPNRNSKRCALLIPSKCTHRPNLLISLNSQMNCQMLKGGARRSSVTG